MSTASGTTPTFTFTFPDELDLSTANNVYVTFKSKNGTVLFTKSGEDVTVSKNVVSVELTQKETLPLKKVFIQINWTYENGKRGSSEIAVFDFSDQLLNEEVY